MCIRDREEVERELHAQLIAKREENLQKEIAKTNEVRYKKQSIKKLKECGIIEAYEFLLDQLCK